MKMTVPSLKNGKKIYCFHRSTVLKNWFINLSPKSKALIHIATILVWFFFPQIPTTEQIKNILIIAWMLIFALEVVLVVFSIQSIFEKRKMKKSELAPVVAETKDVSLVKGNSINNIDAIDYSQVTELVLRSGSDETEFQRFKKILPETVTKKFKPLQNTVGVSGVVEASAIKVLAKNGLFTASVSPDKLMQYSDGSLGSIVQNSGGEIAEHAGFNSAEAAVFAPAIVMQMLSIITSQYYLNGLNEQLQIIQTELNRLKNLNYSGDEGNLFAFQETLKQKLLNRQPDEADFAIIENCKVGSLAIAGKYLSMLSKQAAPEKTGIHLSEDKRLDEIINNLHGTDGEYYMDMISTSYNLSLLADIAYIKTLAYLNPQKNYTTRIQDYIRNMNNSLSEHQQNYVEGSKVFYNSYEALIDKYRLKHSYTYSRDSSLTERISGYMDKWNEKIYSVEKSPCIGLKNNLIDYLTKPKEVLVCIGENGEKTFLMEE